MTESPDAHTSSPHTHSPTYTHILIHTQSHSSILLGSKNHFLSLK
jgi:hypothetical protein